MIAWTKARRLPGVRCWTSRTMAMLPLYFIACPLRRSFAAAMGFGGRFAVERPSSTTGSRSEQLELRQVLGIHDPDRDLVVIHHHEVVDPVPFQQIQHFHCQPVLLHRD